MQLFNLLMLFLGMACPDTGYFEIKDENPVHIETPALHGRQTAKIRLCNGLEAFLISDPGADQSSAALAVGAGSWLDPKEYPGTAHFLEHLLFLGNEAYPEEDAFMGYVQSNGGGVNAYTSTDRTVYIFSTNNNAFEGALDRFSHFFIDPLFNPSGVGRELHAVDQENSKNIQNDSWRWWMILKETGNQESPNATFNTGNAQTLGQIPPSEVRKWWMEHYSADQMHLVIYSNQSIDELKKLAVSKFGLIEKRLVDDQIGYVPILSNRQKGHIIYVEPVRDVRDLTLVWEMPTWAVTDMPAKFPQLVAYTLSSGADNSLKALLREKGLADDASASSMRLSQENALFTLSVDLTEAGVQNVSEVIDDCFSAIERLKQDGIPPYIFDELGKMAQTEYAWQTRQGAYSYAQSIAGEMLYEPLATYPSQTLFFKQYNPEKIRTFARTLSPESCLFTLTASPDLTGVEPEKTEKWLGGRYAVRPFDTNGLTLAAVNQIGLPKPNPYIPEKIQVAVKTDQAIPDLIVNDSFGTAYYTSAPDFQVPDVSMMLAFKSPLIDGTPRYSALLDLYIMTLKEQLTSPIFYASVAGIDAAVSTQDLSLTFMLSGFSNKAPTLLSELTQAAKNVKPTENDFVRLKNSLKTNYINQQNAMPFMQANQLMASAIYNDAPTPESLQKSLENITYEDFNEFADKLFQKTYLEALFAGNISQDETASLWENISTTFSGRPYPKNAQLQKQVFLLNKDSGPYAIPADTPMQGNAVILLIEQGDMTYKSRAAQEILGTALSDDFFKTLRTKQQTGYIARGWKRNVSDQLLQYFGVQSATHSPDDLLSRFELFLENFVKDFSSEFSKERFAEVKNGVITTLTNPPTNLDDYASRQFAFAYKHDADFEYLDNIAKAAESITYDEIRQYAIEFFSRSNNRRLAVLLQGAPTGGAFRYQELSPIALKNEGSFTKP